MAQTVKNLPAIHKTQVRFDPWIRKIPWRKEWQPPPGFLPGKFHGQRNLEGYSPWDRKESDTTEWLTLPLKMASALRELPFCSPTLEVNIISPKVYLVFYFSGKVPLLLALLESLLSPPPRGASLSWIWLEVSTQSLLSNSPPSPVLLGLASGSPKGPFHFKCYWEDPEGSGGEGGGRRDRDREYMYIQGWFMSMYDKNHYNIVK